MRTKSLIGMRRFSPARRNVRLFITCTALAAAFLFMLIFITCDQASLFYNISVETAPISSIIPGHPSKIVKQEVQGQPTKLYVANGDLWKFDGNDWNKIISMDDKGPEYISDVAASDNGDIYYLTREHNNTDGDTARIYKINETQIAQNNYDGTQIGEGKYVSDGGLDYCQNIFCEHNELFSSGPLDNATDSGPQRYDNDNGTWSPVNITGLLKGVVYVKNSYYYYATSNNSGGGGLWKETSPLKDKSGTDITADIIGIIDIDGTHLAAVSSGKTIYQIDTSNDSVSSVSIGSRFTGALAVWTNPQNKDERLLLVGYYNYGEYYKNGYREIVINTDDSFDANKTFNMPGATSPTSIKKDDEAKFEGLMGKRIINSIIQYPGESSYTGTLHPMFASTQKDGLYSYRCRSNGKEEWNGEE